MQLIDRRSCRSGAHQIAIINTGGRGRNLCVDTTQSNYICSRKHQINWIETRLHHRRFFFHVYNQYESKSLQMKLSCAVHTAESGIASGRGQSFVDAHSLPRPTCPVHGGTDNVPSASQHKPQHKQKEKRMVKHSWFLLDGLKVLSEPSISSGLSTVYNTFNVLCTHTHMHIYTSTK